MDGASNRGIDSIKELIEHTKYKPAIGKYKIFIIDEVHMLTKEAFNALLKTLEEPPAYIKFILATTDPLKMPATILSRTQHFRFKKIPQKLTTEHLASILVKEGVTYDNNALDIISRSGSGSLRDSMTLLDQAIVFSQNHLDVKTVTDMLGIIEPTVLDNLLDNLQLKNQDEILKFLDFATDYEAEMIIDELTLHLKDQLFSDNSKFSMLIIDRLFRVLADSKQLLSLGSDGEFVLSLMLFKMMEALSLKDIDSVIKTLKKELSNVDITTTTVQTPKETTTQTEPIPNPAPEPIKTPIPDSTPKEPVITNTVEQKLEQEVIPNTGQTEPQEPQKQTATSASPTQIKTPINTVQQQPTAVDTAIPTAPEQPQDSGNLKFKTLVDKIFDRDYELGACFEANIEYESFKDNALTWHSSAEDDEKKLLIQHWSIIKMFVQELYGFDTKIVNIPTQTKKKTNVTSEQKSSCIAPPSDGTEATKEKDSSEILEEPMIKEILEHFQPKKVRIIKNS